MKDSSFCILTVDPYNCRTSLLDNYSSLLLMLYKLSKGTEVLVSGIGWETLKCDTLSDKGFFSLF